MQRTRVERLARQHGLVKTGLFTNDEDLDYNDVMDFVRELWALQPMATAPKDREILVKVEMRAGMPGRWLVGHYMPGGYCIEDHPPIDEGWYFWNGMEFDRASKPTGWMYLPDDERE